MTRKNILIIWALCLFSLPMHAEEQYVPCYIELQNGEFFECAAILNPHSIRYKLNPNETPVTVKIKDVRFARFFNKDRVQIVSGMPVVDLMYAARGVYSKQSCYFWVYFLDDPQNEDVAVFYHYAPEGDYYGCYKRGTSYGVDLYTESSLINTGIKRKACAEFFSDCDDVVQYLKNRNNHFKKLDDFISIVKEYKLCQKSF